MGVFSAARPVHEWPSQEAVSLSRRLSTRIETSLIVSGAFLSGRGRRGVPSFRISLCSDLGTDTFNDLSIPGGRPTRDRQDPGWWSGLPLPALPVFTDADATTRRGPPFPLPYRRGRGRRKKRWAVERHTRHKLDLSFSLSPPGQLRSAGPASDQVIK